MARINLLPWREELRKKKKQEFLGAIGFSVLVTFIILGLTHFYFEGLKAYQEQRNRMLQTEIVFLDKKIVEIKSIEEKKSKLLSKIELIQKLQESRPEIVHLFAEIPKAAPDGVFLSRFTQKGTDLIFEGKSQSNARVSAFMMAIEASSWLSTPKLNVIQKIKKTDSEQLSDFTLHAKLGRKNSGKAESGSQ
ncbi:MAG: PilN domain-containing protein [Methylococcales bacterium]|nr:PilN domain-containing protein [Methylococcales bacterium]